MPSNFVRYRSDLQSIDPHVDEVLAKITRFWEEKGRQSPVTEGAGRALRGAHAKSFGVVRAEVEILRNVPKPYAQGIYTEPGHHDALARFSSTSNHLGPDHQLGAGLGFALKMFDVPGTKLMPDEPDATTFDLVLKSIPIFIANTAAHYLFIEEVVNDLPNYVSRGTAGFHELLVDFLTGKGTLAQSDWAWEELFAFVKTATQTPVQNPMLATYFSMAAFRHGDYVAKVRVAPARESSSRVIHSKLDLDQQPDVFYATLADELSLRDFYFDLQVQLCTDLEKMPVNELTVEWPEGLSPFVTVGRIRLPRQDVEPPGADEKGDELAFNQWRVTADHTPLGEIMDIRRVYSQSAKVRRTINQQTQDEPVRAEEVLS